jgi:hypothetical protein
MKQLPDILTSATFWASVGTLWAAAGAWFTYVSAALDSRRKTYEDVSNLILGVEVELELVQEWARGGENDQGFFRATRAELIKAHPDWFNPSRSIFTFDTPNLNTLTSSLHIKSMATVIRPLFHLSFSIRRLFDYQDKHRAVAMGDITLYQAVLEKFAPKTAPLEVFQSLPPEIIVTPPAWKIKWEPKEQAYINLIFMMNESIHQFLIGGADCYDDLCLYKAFRSAKGALQTFKGSLRREPLPRWYWILHLLATGLALDGIWQVLRWFDFWPKF